MVSKVRIIWKRTRTVVSAGEVAHELQLHPCQPVFLGPDVGYVSVYRFKGARRCMINEVGEHQSCMVSLFAGGQCTLQNEKLRRTCGAAFWIQCMQYLFPQVKCKQNGTIPHSGARSPIA